MFLCGPSSLQHKNGQLGPDNNPWMFCVQVLKCVEAPIVIVFLTNGVKQANLAQIIAPEMAKLGPDHNFTVATYK